MDHITSNRSKGRLPNGWENWPLQRKIELLTPKMKEWVKLYVESNNAALATRTVYTNMNDNSAGTYGAKIRQMPLMKAIVGEMGAKIGLNKTSILTALHEEIFKKPAQTPNERSVRLKAIDTVCKIMGIYTSDSSSALEMLPKIIDYKFKEESNDLFEETKETKETNGNAPTTQIPETDTGE